MQEIRKSKKKMEKVKNHNKQEIRKKGTQKSRNTEKQDIRKGPKFEKVGKSEKSKKSEKVGRWKKK